MKALAHWFALWRDHRRLSRGLKIVLMGIVIAAGLLALRQCAAHRQQVEQARQDIRSANALSETAKQAARIVIDQAGEEAAIDDLVDQTAKEIANAPDEKIARRAALRAICSLPDYRFDSACRL